MSNDQREVQDDADFSALEKSLPEGFCLQFLIAYNAKGEEFILSRKSIRVEDGQWEDEGWRTRNEDLALQRNEYLTSEQNPTYDFSHTRLGVSEGQDAVNMTVEFSRCRHRPVAERCRPFLITIPKSPSGKELSLWNRL